MATLYNHILKYAKGIWESYAANIISIRQLHQILFPSGAHPIRVIVPLQNFRSNSTESTCNIQNTGAELAKLLVPRFLSLSTRWFEWH